MAAGITRIKRRRRRMHYVFPHFTSHQHIFLSFSARINLITRKKRKTGQLWFTQDDTSSSSSSVLTRHFFWWQLSSSCPVVIARHTKTHKSISSFYDPIIGWPKSRTTRTADTQQVHVIPSLSYFLIRHFSHFLKEKGKQKSCLFGRFRQQRKKEQNGDRLGSGRLWPATLDGPQRTRRFKRTGWYRSSRLSFTFVWRWRKDPVRRNVPPLAMTSLRRIWRPSATQRRDNSTNSATGCTCVVKTKPPQKNLNHRI